MKAKDSIQVLLFLFEREEDRQRAFEQKLSNIQNQTVLFISLFTVFVATTVPQLRAAAGWFQTVLGIIFIASILIAGRALRCSTKTLDPRGFQYMSISPESFSSRKFTRRKLRTDLVKSIRHNNEMNNHKASFLIESRKWLSYAVYLQLACVVLIGWHLLVQVGYTEFRHLINWN